jgi:hypothetical protein
MTSWLPARESTAIGWRRSSSSAASIVRLSMSSGCPRSAKCSCNRGCWNGRGARAQASRPGQWSIWKSVRARAPVVGSSATSTAAAASIRLTRGVAPAPTQGHPAVRRTWHPMECRRSGFLHRDRNNPQRVPVSSRYRALGKIEPAFLGCTVLRERQQGVVECPRLAGVPDVLQRALEEPPGFPARSHGLVGRKQRDACPRSLGCRHRHRSDATADPTP